MTKKEFERLLKKHGAKELAECFVFPVKLSPQEKKEADAAMSKYIQERRSQMSEEQKTRLNLMQLRFKIEDTIKESQLKPTKTFGYYLKSYIDTFNKKQTQFANEINIKPAELSQYINGHRLPPQYVLIRLELHSNNTIPAVIWYRLAEKETIHELNTNKDLRKEQKKFVRQSAKVA